MEADPGLAVVAARRHMIDERSRVLVPRRGLTGLTGMRSSVEVARHVVRSGANPIGEPGGVLFRREHYFAVGGWRPEHRFVMDLDLWIRLLQYGEFLGLPETLAAFRIGRESLSADNEATIYAEQKAYLEELGATPHLQVRSRTSLLGRMRAPLGRMRRRALFRMSAARPAATSAGARGGLTLRRTSFAADTASRLAWPSVTPTGAHRVERSAPWSTSTTGAPGPVPSPIPA